MFVLANFDDTSMRPLLQVHLFLWEAAEQCGDHYDGLRGSRST
jgi:hypothetical protein